MLTDQLCKKLTVELDKIQEKQLFRRIKNLAFPNATHAIDDNGHRLLVLASNNYLGLTHNPNVLKAGQAALNAGSGSGGARLTTGGSKQLACLEKMTAEFKGCEAALFFNTGYMANVGVLSTLADAQDVIFSDELNHASIIDGARLSKAKIVVYKHADPTDLICKLQSHKHFAGNKFIVTDSVFSMDGDIAPLPQMAEISNFYQANLITDDAHAVGVLGKSGSGSTEHFDLKGRVAVQIGTFSKALAGEGGYAAGSKLMIDYLINKARPFIFSTATSPLNAAMVTAALSELKDNPKLIDNLHSNSQLMQAELIKHQLPIIKAQTPIIPIIVGEASVAIRFSQALYQAGILVTAIRPPSVEVGKSRLRLTVNSAHNPEELKRAACIISDIYHDIKDKAGESHV